MPERVKMLIGTVDVDVMTPDLPSEMTVNLADAPGEVVLVATASTPPSTLLAQPCFQLPQRFYAGQIAITVGARHVE